MVSLPLRIPVERAPVVGTTRQVLIIFSAEVAGEFQRMSFCVCSEREKLRISYGNFTASAPGASSFCPIWSIETIKIWLAPSMGAGEEGREMLNGVAELASFPVHEPRNVLSIQTNATNAEPPLRSYVTLVSSSVLVKWPWYMRDPA